MKNAAPFAVLFEDETGVVRREMANTRSEAERLFNKMRIDFSSVWIEKNVDGAWLVIKETSSC